MASYSKQGRRKSFASGVIHVDQAATICLFTHVSARGSARLEGLIRKPFSDRQKGGSFALPSRALNPRKARPVRVTERPAGHWASDPERAAAVRAKMRKAWTQERRAAQARRMRRQKLWEKARGRAPPKDPEKWRRKLRVAGLKQVYGSRWRDVAERRGVVV